MKNCKGWGEGKPMAQRGKMPETPKQPKKMTMPPKPMKARVMHIYHHKAK